VNVSYTGLKAPLTVAHFHGPATAAQAASVLVGLVPEISDPGATSGLIRGSVTLTEQQRQFLLDGLLYINLHTSAHASGEIRGQVVPKVAPNYIVIASDNVNEEVIFDGSTSWDADGDALTYAWFEAPLPDGTPNPVPPTTGGKKSSKKKSSHGQNGGNEDDCEFGKVAELTLQYNGTAAAMVGVAQKNRAVLFFAVLQPGEHFTFDGAGKNGDMSPEIAVFVNGVANAAFDTSGKTHLGPGQWSGHFLVVSGKTIKDGELCPLTPPPLDERVQFGTGVVASRTLHLGLHAIELQVSDGLCDDTATVYVEVITPSQAVDKCIALVESSSIDRKSKRPLTEALKQANKEFDKGKMDKGVDKLEAFIKKVQKDKDINAADKAELVDCAQDIIDAME
jgi:hypothetical protein